MCSPDHVALVVPRLEPVLERLDALGLLGGGAGPIEEFPSEGTREVYVGSAAGKLLLLQPLSTAGPYARALAERGPGLHHVAVHAPDLQGFLAEVRGWLLHPASLGTLAASGTVWLARPGLPLLIELRESEPARGPATVEGIEVPGELGRVQPRAGLTPSPDADVWLTLGGVRLKARSLALGGP